MSKNLKDTIDRMVEDSIRRVLPSIMNEVLLKTIAGAGVIQERGPVNKPAYPYIPENAGKQVKVKNRRPSSLGDILDETAGSEFYSNPGAAMAEATREEAPSQRQMAQRVQALPPHLQQLAEDVNLDDDGGEMWGEDDHDSASPSDMGPPLDRAAKAVGLDFSRMKQVAKVTESKKPAADDRAARVQFEQMRLKRDRERLNGGKPVE